MIYRRVWCRFVLFLATSMIERNKSGHDIKSKTRLLSEQQVKDISKGTQQLCVPYYYDFVHSYADPSSSVDWFSGVSGVL